MHTKSILVFDTTYFEKKNNLVDICTVIWKHAHHSPDSHIIVLNGSYMRSHEPLQQLATQALTKPRAYIEDEFSKFKRIISLTIQNVFTDETQQKQVLHAFHSDCNDILSLLHGICAVKEISAKTFSSLLKIASHIASVLIVTMLQNRYPMLHCAISNVLSVSKTLQHTPICIIPIENIPHTIDFVATRLAKKYKAKKVAIWNNLMGIQTADPTIISQAKTVKELDYTTALEISYLGGKFFHPSALYELSQHNIPIMIHSLHSQAPITTIHNQAKINSTTCITITHRKDFIILTLRSADMFHQHGYLEKIFAICHQHKVSIETLTTSEISVTMTFHKSYFSTSFVTSLKKLGEVLYQTHRAIISLIGKDCWTTPTKTGDILQSLHTVAINTISLGQTGSNLSIIIAEQDLQKALIQLHSTLFEH